MKKALLFSVVSFFIISCASTVPEPTQSQSALLIGQVLHSCKGSALNQYNVLLGEHKKGITIISQHKETNKLYYIYSDKNGLLISTALPAGEYIIKKISVDVTINYNSASSWTVPTEKNNDPKYFTVTEGKVNNIGFISWYAVLEEGTRIDMNKEYDKVQNFFTATYPGSAWLKKEWLPVFIRPTEEPQKNKTPEI